MSSRKVRGKRPETPRVDELGVAGRTERLVTGRLLLTGHWSGSALRQRRQDVVGDVEGAVDLLDVVQLVERVDQA